jgi:hypothetical protein
MKLDYLLAEWLLRLFSRKVPLFLIVLSIACLGIPLVNAQSTPITIPKLSYSPTIGQLVSDWKLQQEMVAVDMRVASIAPVTARTLIGFDSSNLDFLLDFVTETQKNSTSIYINIGMNKLSEVSHVPTNETFLVVCTWYLSTNKTKTEFYPGYANSGGEGFGNPVAPPSGFTWTAAFDKTYLNQQQSHIVFAIQIPNYFVGPGGSGGKYEIFLSLGVDQSTQGPSYPFDAQYFSPMTYGSFNTQYPIPEFNLTTEIVAAATLIATLLSQMRKRTRLQSGT